jgi:hypothetical protein
MKRYKGIDYAWRPQDYWDDQDALAAILRNVKGKQRRRMICDYWRAGRLEELQDELLKDTLSPEARESLGRIHPSFMGGEYLPDYESTEVEIARIELESTTSDVISIRAQRRAKTIRYRVVDEYDTEFQLQRKSSRRPLSLQELIKFLEGSGYPEQEQAGGLITGYNDGTIDGRDRHDFRHFTRIHSVCYPELEAHCEHVFDDWVEEGTTVGAEAEVGA